MNSQPIVCFRIINDSHIVHKIGEFCQVNKTISRKSIITKIMEQLAYY